MVNLRQAVFSFVKKFPDCVGIQPKQTQAVIVAGETATYLFIPAAAVINVEAKVVRVIK
jgi:hypothetical protein